MSFPHSHKTVIVLDRSPHFLRSSKQNVEFDVFTKSRVPGIIPLAPIVKSLWTCNVEAAIEYCRIVYDIYPQNKLIQLVLSDTVATTVNSWEQQEQNIQKLMLTLARQGPPSQASARSDENNIIYGLTEAVELLCQPTSTQHARRTTLSDSPLSVANRGRIICLTSLKSESHIHMIEECMQDVLTQHNSLAASTDNLMPLSHLELVLVHVVPVSHESAISHKPGREISSHLWSEVHVSQSGRFIATKMVELSMQHFKLSCTTVTGIPMKEEQNASSSANYDVELLHSRQTHLEVSRTGVGAVEGMIMPSKEGLFIDTVTLKWCTPRTNAVGKE
ncbi:hypothetical protein NP493_640g02004 [Ridgeia piscesae]|uniref:Cell cycle regulator Mat89Bb n=1 Tax=Ridgeia piscesae TaxID=27915 RepID=A0AAD9NQF0_RIDPI|nr:hypothetical protein NP493_640g02004 [Ridgeia piscesae]